MEETKRHIKKKYEWAYEKESYSRQLRNKTSGKFLCITAVSLFTKGAIQRLVNELFSVLPFRTYGAQGGKRLCISWSACPCNC